MSNDHPEGIANLRRFHNLLALAITVGTTPACGQRDALQALPAGPTSNTTESADVASLESTEENTLRSDGQKADNAPPVHPQWDFDKWPRSQKSPVSKVAFGDFNVELEKTPLEAVRRFAGVGAIQHRGDAHESQYWLCYTSDSSGGPERIWFESGEMGGADRAVLSFQAKAVSRTAPEESADCPILPKSLLPVSLGNRIWLGSSETQLNKFLGEPSARRGDWRYYASERKIQLDTEDFYELGYLAVKIEEAVIAHLYQSQITSN
ncbi:MAG: hypothetical protein ABL957_12785 [Parvularculaceae bacterium]